MHPTEWAAAAVAAMLHRVKHNVTLEWLRMAAEVWR